MASKVSSDDGLLLILMIFFVLFSCDHIDDEQKHMKRQEEVLRKQEMFLDEQIKAKNKEKQELKDKPREYTDP